MDTVREINNLDELAGFRWQWNSLLQQTPGALFFHAHAWLEAYWTHFGAGQRLRVLVVHDHGRVVGILPLVVRTRRRRLGSLRVLTYPLDDWGGFYGPIGSDPTFTLLAALDYIRRTRRDWDLIELAWVDALGSDRGRTRRAMHDAGLGATGRAPASERPGRSGGVCRLGRVLGLSHQPLAQQCPPLGKKTRRAGPGDLPPLSPGGIGRRRIQPALGFV